MFSPTRLFLLLWSLSTFIHYADEWNYAYFTWALLFVCLSGFFIKKLNWAWALYLGVSTPILFYSMPILANHLMFTFFVNLFLFYKLTVGSLKADDSLAVPLRWALAVVYFWAGIHKINTDFLYDIQSCAHSFAQQINETYFTGLLPDSVVRSPAIPYLIIATELTIALCIVTTRAFFIGLILSVLLHLHLAALEFVDFSIVALSLLTLSLFSYEKTHQEKIKKISKIIYGFVILEAAAGVYSFFDLKKGMGSVGYWLQSFVLMAFGLLILFYGVKITFRGSVGQKIKVRTSYFVFPGLLFIVGSFNYIGLSTSGTFSMFSNIKTEGQEWNHLFMPKFLKIFHYQDQIYWVENISKKFEGTTHEHPYSGYGMPEIELYRNLEIWKKQGAGPGYISYEFNGQTYKSRNIIEDPQFKDSPYNWLETKLLYFRRIQKPGYQIKCLW